MVFTFDLKLGYHHVEIHDGCWKYLGLNGILRIQRTILYLRYCPLGYHSHVILLSCHSPWRSHGLKVVIYLRR